VRRVGLVLFGVEAGEKFDAQKHRAHGVENPPADAAVVETLAPGITFQGRLVRPALVRLHEAGEPVAPEIKKELSPEAD
jgi:molecular chaperone GrpE (heat shock protein)